MARVTGADDSGQDRREPDNPALTPNGRTAWNRWVVMWADQSDLRYRQALKLLGWRVEFWRGSVTEPVSFDQLTEAGRRWGARAPSRRTLARRLAELERLGMVRVKRSGRRPGVRLGANVYWLDFRMAVVAGAVVPGRSDIGTTRPSVLAGQRDFGTARPHGGDFGTTAGTTVGTTNPGVAAGQRDFGTSYGYTGVRSTPPVVTPTGGRTEAEAMDLPGDAPYGRHGGDCGGQLAKNSSDGRLYCLTCVRYLEAGDAVMVDSATRSPPACGRHQRFGPRSGCEACEQLAGHGGDLGPLTGRAAADSWARDHSPLAGLALTGAR